MDLRKELSFRGNTQVTLSWRHVNYTLQIGKEKKTILVDVSGRVCPGNLLALLGPSGSGKTTLLNTLASRIPITKNAQFSGELLVNGVAGVDVAKLSAYVEQVKSNMDPVQDAYPSHPTSGRSTVRASQRDVRTHRSVSMVESFQWECTTERLSIIYRPLTSEIQVGLRTQRGYFISPSLQFAPTHPAAANGTTHAQGKSATGGRRTGGVGVVGVPRHNDRQRASSRSVWWRATACEHRGASHRQSSDSVPRYTALPTPAVVPRAAPLEGCPAHLPDNPGPIANHDATSIPTQSPYSPYATSDARYEPTSGLDSFQAQNVMTTLKSMAESASRTVVASVHQPRSSIYSMLDYIMLLAQGSTVYFGPAGTVCSDYFKSIGEEVPREFNPCDFYLDIISVNYKSEHEIAETQKRVDTLKSAWSGSAEAERLEENQKRAKAADEKTAGAVHALQVYLILPKPLSTPL
eukprot:1195944-Prorocentrum_minimum.AAC.2